MEHVVVYPAHDLRLRFAERRFGCRLILASIACSTFLMKVRIRLVRAVLRSVCRSICRARLRACGLFAMVFLA